VVDEVLFTIDGRPMWRLGGVLLPVIAGGAGDAGDGGDGDGDSGQDGAQGGTITRPGGTPDASGTDAEPDEPPDAWPKEAKDMFRKLRKIADGARRDAQRATDQLQQRQSAGMTEAERAAARVRELETEREKLTGQLRLRSKQEAFREAGIAAKAKSPGTLYRLIDDDAIEWGPDGEIINAPELVAELKRSESWMFEPRGARGSADAAQGADQQPAQRQTDENQVFNRWFRGAAGRST
jgi:hypothetical protein